MKVRECICIYIVFRDASYPNAKIAPPRKGDDDLNRRSNKLNGVQYFLKTEIATAVEIKYEEFQERFLSLDPFRTGFISAAEFCAILHEICDDLDDIDSQEIATAYDTNHDDRFDL